MAPWKEAAAAAFGRMLSSRRGRTALIAAPLLLSAWATAGAWESFGCFALMMMVTVPIAVSISILIIAMVWATGALGRSLTALAVVAAAVSVWMLFFAEGLSLLRWGGVMIAAFPVIVAQFQLSGLFTATTILLTISPLVRWWRRAPAPTPGD